MVLEFSPQSWPLVLYIVLLFAGIISRESGLKLVCGIGAVVLGLYAMTVFGFWIGIIMAGVAGCIAVAGFTSAN